MSGYRDRTSFDPNAGGDYGPPLRPFNKWQWTGVGFILFGVAAMLAALVARFGMIHVDTKDWLPMAAMFSAVGSSLVNSRRQPGRLRSETRRKRMVILAGVLMLFGAALITILVVKGA